MKKIYLEEKNLIKIYKGVKKVNDVVKVTLGGRGKNVAMMDEQGIVQIINDGVTIANQLGSQNPIENIGINLAKQVAIKTNQESGDGTTTSIILLQSYLKALKLNIKNLDKSGSRELREKIEKEVEIVCEELDKIKFSILDSDIENVAKVSSLDNNIAKAISEVISKIGKDGAIVVEDNKKPGIEHETVAGINIENGYVSPLFMTDSNTRKSVLNNSPVLLSEKKIDDISQIMPLLEQLGQQGKTMITIFCKDISDDVLTFLIVNKAQGKLNSLVVVTDEMKEIETVTGAKIIDDINGREYKIENLGLAGKIVSGVSETSVIDGKEDPAKIEAQINKLKKQLEKVESDAEKFELQERIAKLKGAVAIIKIAGSNDVETREKKLKMEDAINAVRSAMKDGVVVGGGMALFRVANKLYSNSEEGLTKLDTMTKMMMFDILTSPLIQLLNNAEESEETYQKLFKEDYEQKGYNVVTRKFENFKESGVLDPVGVTKSALRNAVSMGNTIMTVEAAVISTTEKNAKEEN